MPYIWEKMIWVICVYAPQEGKPDIQSIKFYNELVHEWDMKGTKELTLGIGDFNDHVGKKVDGFEGVHISSMLKWLECWDCDRYGLGSIPACTILFCLWERHFMALSSALWSWQAALNFHHISIKFQVGTNIWHLQKQVGLIA